MYHELIRVLAYINLFLAVVAMLLIAPLVSIGIRTETEAAQRNLSFFYCGVLAVSSGLLTVSGVGILRRRRWARVVALVLGGLQLGEGVLHLIRAQWGPALFCIGYGALVAWLLLHPINRGYFASPKD